MLNFAIILCDFEFTDETDGRVGKTHK